MNGHDQQFWRGTSSDATDTEATKQMGSSDADVLSNSSSSSQRALSASDNKSVTRRSEVVTPVLSPTNSKRDSSASGGSGSKTATSDGTSSDDGEKDNGNVLSSSTTELLPFGDDDDGTISTSEMLSASALLTKAVTNDFQASMQALKAYAVMPGIPEHAQAGLKVVIGKLEQQMKPVKKLAQQLHQHKKKWHDLALKEELSLTGRKTSGWFVEFVNHANEKELMGDVFDALVAGLAEEGFPLNPMVADLGCGAGKLSRQVAKSLCVGKPKDKTQYIAVDNDANFVDSTVSALKAEHVPNATGVVGSCFSPVLLSSRLPEHLGMVVLSNVVYYAQDDELSSLVSQVKEKLDKNGVAVFMHEDVSADPNKMRRKYEAPVYDMHTTHKIAESLKSAKVEFVEIKTDSLLKFPVTVSPEIWRELHNANHKNDWLKRLPSIDKQIMDVAIMGPLRAKVKQICENRSEFDEQQFREQILIKTVDKIVEDKTALGLQEFPYLDKPLSFVHNLNVVKKLLEFVVQRPLEALAEEGRLGEFLDDMRTTLEQQNNTLIVRSKYQIAMSPERSEEFAQALTKVASKIQAEQKPSTTVLVQQVNELASGEEKQRS